MDDGMVIGMLTAPLVPLPLAVAASALEDLFGIGGAESAGLGESTVFLFRLGLLFTPVSFAELRPVSVVEPDVLDLRPDGIVEDVVLSPDDAPPLVVVTEDGMTGMGVGADGMGVKHAKMEGSLHLARSSQSDPAPKGRSDHHVGSPISDRTNSSTMQYGLAFDGDSSGSSVWTDGLNKHRKGKFSVLAATFTGRSTFFI
jgi:hypothetical protein